MNRKIIIIITVLICLCAAFVTAQHFTNKEEETKAPPVAVEAEHTEQDNKVPAVPTSKTAEAQGTEQTEEPSQKTTEATSKKNNTLTSNRQSEAQTQTTAGTSKAQSTTKPPSTTTTTTTTTKKQTVTVTISISCEKALAYGKDVPQSGYFLSPCKYTVSQDATVFDVLEAVAKENGITLKYQSKSYIQAINGLGERDCGAGSGWTYSVNGVKPNKASTKYTVSDGDVIEWYYVTNPTD